MSLNKAFEKVSKLPGRTTLLCGIDGGDSWIFKFHDKPITNTEDFVFGGFYDVVDKQTMDHTVEPASIPFMSTLKNAKRVM